ncbi:MAG: D-lyxose/D-mannose family sugar isomerase, partial [Roseiflexaceae bacterium]
MPPLTSNAVHDLRLRTAAALASAGIFLTSTEQSTIEIADCGLGEIMTTGLQLITYINTDRCCAKELVLFAHQLFPEHRHPPVGADPGK